MMRALIIKYGDPKLADAMANAVTRPASDAVRRVAMHQHTPEEWDEMTLQAQYDYGRNKAPGRIRGTILGLWALLWTAIFAEYARLSAINRG